MPLGEKGTSTVEKAPEPSSNNKRKKIIIALIAIIVIIIIIILLLLRACNDSWYDDAVQFGYYDGKSKEDILKDLNAKVEEGMMGISIASIIPFEDGTSDGEARIENIEANHVDQKVTITLNDTGQVVYQSKAIAPGQYIQRIRLSEDLPAGRYEATAKFQGYDRETHEEKGSLMGGVEIVVMN